MYSYAEERHPTLYMGCTLAPPGEYSWTVRLRRRCGLVSNYFDHLFQIQWLRLLDLFDFEYCSHIWLVNTQSAFHIVVIMNKRFLHYSGKSCCTILWFVWKQNHAKNVLLHRKRATLWWPDLLDLQLLHIIPSPFDYGEYHDCVFDPSSEHLVVNHTQSVLVTHHLNCYC